MNQPNMWRGRRVFVTGHTGFKGTWLTHVLALKGAHVSGYALKPQTTPDMFTLTAAAEKLEHSDIGDIRDLSELKRCMVAANPDVVIHMAAQPFVRRSYGDPVETWSSNVMGTVNCFEAVRACSQVAAVLVVTTDKCYENNAWEWGYRETDALGGHDPYSASKAAAELVTNSYRKSFFKNGPLVASARAGNVIGGGDFSEDRLVPDIYRAVASSGHISIRNFEATRPWQHVLDCLSGYLLLCESLLRGESEHASGFNFGPDIDANISVGAMLEGISKHWPAVKWDVVPDASAPHEAAFLYLDSAKARSRLGWRPRWSLPDALLATAGWYRSVLADKGAALGVTLKQIERHGIVS